MQISVTKLLTRREEKIFILSGPPGADIKFRVEEVRNFVNKSSISTFQDASRVFPEAV
jgi:hypothetical protein